jgi:uncharacterized protein (TIGR02266 family)
MADEGASDQGPAGGERRTSEPFAAELNIDGSSGDHFLFSYIKNISEMGIFIRSDAPAAVGTALRLRFSIPGEPALELSGVVTWINPVRPDGLNLNPGMGVHFRDLTPEQRERLVAVVKTVAYLNDEPPTHPRAVRGL